MSKSSNERVKASQAQIDFLMRYMKENAYLTRPLKEKLLTTVELHEKWESLALSLNGIEGAKKSMPQWQKTWRDIQNSMRKKGLNSELETSTTDEYRMDFDEQIDGLNIFVLDDSQTTETQDVIDQEKTVEVKPTHRAKLNNRQLDHLLRHMKRNSEMCQPVTNKGLLVRAQLEQRWVRLAHSLNDLGPPCKTVNKWKQTWRDMRNKMRKKRKKNGKDVEEEDNDSDIEVTGQQTQSNRSGKLNHRQLSHILSHMKRYGGDLLKAVSRPGDGSWRNRMRLEAHWTQLTQSLNNLGPPCKPLHRWRQTWRDLKRKMEMKDRTKDILMEDLDSDYNEENTNDSVEVDTKPDITEEGLFRVTSGEELFRGTSAEGLFRDASGEDREENVDFNPIFVDAVPIDGASEVISQQTSKTDSMQSLIEFEKESLDLRRRQIALEEKRMELKEKKLLTEEAKVQALQRIAAALEQNNLNNFNRFNLT